MANDKTTKVLLECTTLKTTREFDVTHAKDC